MHAFILINNCRYQQYMTKVITLFVTVQLIYSLRLGAHSSEASLLNLSTVFVSSFAPSRSKLYILSQKTHTGIRCMLLSAKLQYISYFTDTCIFQMLHGLTKTNSLCQSSTGYKSIDVYHSPAIPTRETLRALLTWQSCESSDTSSSCSSG